MTRGRSSPLKAADTATHKGGAVLIEMLFDAGALRLCIGPYNITAGGNLYQATGALLAVEEHQEAVDGLEGLTFSLSGLDPAVLSLAIDEPYHRRPLRMLELRFDADHQPVGAPVAEYIGRMTAITSTEEPGGRTHRVTVATEHYDADARRVSEIRFSDAEQRRRYSTDAGFEYAAGLTDRTLKRT